MTILCRFGKATAIYDSSDGWADGPLYPQLQAETDYFLSRPASGYDPDPALTLCQWVTAALAGSIVSVTGRNDPEPGAVY